MLKLMNKKLGITREDIDQEWINKAATDNLPLLKLLVKLRGSIAVYKPVFAAARAGQLDVVKWLEENFDFERRFTRNEVNSLCSSLLKSTSTPMKATEWIHTIYPECTIQIPFSLHYSLVGKRKRME